MLLIAVLYMYSIIASLAVIMLILFTAAIVSATLEKRKKDAKRIAAGERDASDQETPGDTQ